MWSANRVLNKAYFYYPVTVGFTLADNRNFCIIRADSSFSCQKVTPVTNPDTSWIPNFSYSYKGTISLPNTYS